MPGFLFSIHRLLCHLLHPASRQALVRSAQYSTKRIPLKAGRRNGSPIFILQLSSKKIFSSFTLGYSPFTILHSVLKLLTGLATAALIAWKLTVINVIAMANNTTKTKTP